MAFVQHPAFPDDAPQSVSDPDAWVEQGWVLVSEQEAADLDPTITPRPAGNASRDEWLAYALAQPNADEATYADLTRDEIRDRFAE
jgi:hypothetical protein